MVAERQETRGRLRCDVARGMFDNERVIKVTLPGGKHITAFADEHDVIVNGELPEEGSVPGRVLVWVIAREGDGYWVDLPQGGFEGGPRIRVPASFLT